MSKTLAKNIVILGAGFGGLAVALRLAKKMPRDHWQIHLVDRTGHHLYTPLLYEVAAGHYRKETADCEGLLKAGVCLEIEDLHFLLEGKRVMFHETMVEAIEVNKQTVRLNNGRRLPYDYLVLALGAETAFYDIPGLAEHSLTLKTATDALLIRKKIQDFLRSAKGEQTFNLVIGGAGATGVEFASEISSCFDMLKEYHRKLRLAVTLIDAGERVLSMMPNQLSAWAMKRLDSLGVDVMLQSRVREVTSATITIDHDGQDELLSYDMLVWAGGIKGNNLLARTAGLPVNERSTIAVDEYLRVKGAKNMFALGDNAFLVDAVTNKPVPAMAQAATREAKVVADNILAMTRSKKQPVKKYDFVNFPAVIPMGGKYALAKIGPLRLRGRYVYFLRKFADLKYFLSILPMRPAFKIWWHGAKVYIQND